MTTAHRLTAQLLAGPKPRDPVAVAERLLAIQAQDLRGARLAVRARARPGLTAADVDRALGEDRSVVITWLNRGTLHIVPAPDYHWLHALTAPPVRPAVARRLANLGVSAEMAERGVDVIERALAADGPLTRAQLSERLRTAGVLTDGQALIQLLAAASLRGVCVRGPFVGRRQAFVLTRDWLPGHRDGRAQHRERSLAELARRYLAGHGPATERDLAKWAGLPLRDARAGLRAIARSLAEQPGGLVDLRARDPVGKLPPPRLLGAFEPVLLGWTSREPLLGAHEPVIVRGGMFGPFALVRGRAVAGWQVQARRVVLEPFGRLAAPELSALDREATDVERFLAG